MWRLPFLFLFLPVAAVHAQAVAPRYVNPSGLVHPNGYTHVIVASDGRTAYVAGQVAFDSTGKVVGAGDFARQADQVYANLKTALASVCASFENVLKTTTFITDVRNIPALREARGRYLDSSHPPTNTLVSVSSLARPELLLEIEAVAEIPAAGCR